MHPVFEKILRERGLRVATPDDPIYQNASWRISFVSRPQRVYLEEEHVRDDVPTNSVEEAPSVCSSGRLSVPTIRFRQSTLTATRTSLKGTSPRPRHVLTALDVFLPQDRYHCCEGRRRNQSLATDLVPNEQLVSVVFGQTESVSVL
jgi:hypothetical protein